MCVLGQPLFDYLDFKLQKSTIIYYYFMDFPILIQYLQLLYCGDFFHRK